MKSELDLLWEDIDIAVDLSTNEAIVAVFDKAIKFAKSEQHNAHEFYFAAGYIAYFHPQGKLSAKYRAEAEKAFLLSLFNKSGFLPAVLYLAFIRMDNKDFMGGLGLLYSFENNISNYKEHIMERYVEAKICCLVESGFIPIALEELDWLDKKKKEDSTFGIDLINLMKLSENIVPNTHEKREVISKIRNILNFY